MKANYILQPGQPVTVQVPDFSKHYLTLDSLKHYLTLDGLKYYLTLDSLKHYLTLDGLKYYLTLDSLNHYLTLDGLKLRTGKHPKHDRNAYFGWIAVLNTVLKQITISHRQVLSTLHHTTAAGHMSVARQLASQRQ